MPDGPGKKRIQAFLPTNLAKAAKVYADQWDLTFEEFTRECFESHVIAHATCCKDSDWIVKANNLKIKANHEKPCFGYCCRACKHKGDPCASGEYTGCWEAAPGIENKIKALSKKRHHLYNFSSNALNLVIDTRCVNASQFYPFIHSKPCPTEFVVKIHCKL